MNNFDRLRELFPIAVAFLLASSVAQLQAKQSFPSRMPNVSVEDVIAGIKWHMLEIAKNEQNQNFGAFGN